MTEEHPNRLREMPATFRGATEWSPADRLVPTVTPKPMRAKVFKSGNSLALRLPAALGLEAGMEMELTAAADGTYALKRADAPKRKIDGSKFIGKAPWLKELTPEDREFEHRELDWHLLDMPEDQS